MSIKTILLTFVFTDPNRYRGLYGAGRAAETASDRPKAVGSLAAKADTARPEIAGAKAFIGTR